MANVNIKFNNKDYLLSCDDGQEESLKNLTKFLDKKYSELKDKLGNIGENNEKVLNFKNNNQRIFSMVRNDKLNDYLLLKIKKSKLIKFKKTKEDYDTLKDNYKIIFTVF